MALPLFEKFQFIKCCLKQYERYIKSAYLTYKSNFMTWSELSTISKSSTDVGKKDPQKGLNFLLSRILMRFPHGNADNGCERTLSIGYGSGVIQQQGRSRLLNQLIDLIIVVENPLKWHTVNMKINPSDYTALMRKLGPNFVTNVQEKGGGQIFYNLGIPFGAVNIKYGVISRNAFIADLFDWNNLYVAGRLHKPVRILEIPSVDLDFELHSALRSNLSNALHTALLTLPEKFSEAELFCRIASLSYLGDFRMYTFGEDVKKISNIVSPSLELFRHLYSGRLQVMQDSVHYIPGQQKLEQDVNSSARYYHLTMLPRNLQDCLVTVWNEVDGKWRDKEDVLQAYAKERNNENLLITCMQNIVWGPSLIQAAKGVASTGLWKSILYGAGKIGKHINSWKS